MTLITRLYQVAWNTVFLHRLTEEQREHTLHETQLLATLHHPNIILILDAWTSTDGR